MQSDKEKVNNVGYILMVYTHNTGSFPILLDKRGNWWRGGSERYVSVGVWSSRAEAGKYANRVRGNIKRKHPDWLLQRISTKPVHFTRVHFDGLCWRS